MQLNATSYGAPTDRPGLLIAHGLFGSARNWSAIAKRLALHRHVIAVDMRNHGDSPRNPDHSYAAMADDLAETIAVNGGRADALGHSMGGKAAMVLALTRPALVNRLIVADMAPVTYHHTQLPYVHAMQAVDLTSLTRRSEANAALAAAIPEAAVRAFLLQSLVLGEQGAAWKLDLDTLERQMPRIMDFPEIDARFDGPTLFLTGATSGYVRPAHWQRIRALFPRAEHCELAGAGHWLHAEAPGAFIKAVAAFLDGS